MSCQQTTSGRCAACTEFLHTVQIRRTTCEVCGSLPCSETAVVGRRHTSIPVVTLGLCKIPVFSTRGKILRSRKQCSFLVWCWSATDHTTGRPLKIKARAAAVRDRRWPPPVSTACPDWPPSRRVPCYNRSLLAADWRTRALGGRGGHAQMFLLRPCRAQLPIQKSVAESVSQLLEKCHAPKEDLTSRHLSCRLTRKTLVVESMRSPPPPSHTRPFHV